MGSEYSITQLSTDHTELIMTARFPRFTPLELFDCFTRPELLVQWWPQQAETDQRQGGSFKLSWPAMDWQMNGEYIHYEPGHRLEFTWRWTHLPELPERLVEIDFSPENNGSRIVLRHSRYTQDPRDQEDRQSHLDGWMNFLSRLQQLSLEDSTRPA